MGYLRIACAGVFATAGFFVGVAILTNNPIATAALSSAFAIVVLLLAIIADALD